jgi:hypothetical protein
MKIRHIQICLFLALLLSENVGFTQVHGRIEQLEDSLKSLSVRIQKAENDSVKLFFNDQFRKTLSRALLLTGSFEYPFDSVKTIAKLTSPDKKFRIFNWNLPKGDGTNIYFGFIQLNPKSEPEQAVYDLIDRSDSIPQPETALLDNRFWYGSLYYKIILTTYNKQKFYTLLGWDPMNSQLTRKVVDVLFFDQSDYPHFGARIFRNFGNDLTSRVIFQYSSSVSMLLIYDEQYLVNHKKWNAGKKQFEKELEKARMIVCDELIPSDPQFEGQYEYYVPSSEVFNGFVFKNGMWNFSKNIEVRNKAK